MSTEEKNTSPVEESLESGGVSAIYDFCPTKEMRLARIDFHVAWRNGAYRDEHGNILTLREALRTLYKSPASFHRDLPKWLKINGFRQWFSRSPVTDFGRYSALLTEVTLDRLYEIMVNPNPKLASAQVACAKLIFQINRLMPDQTKEIIIDATVAALPKEEKAKLVKDAAALIDESSYKSIFDKSQCEKEPLTVSESRGDDDRE